MLVLVAPQLRHCFSSSCLPSLLLLKARAGNGTAWRLACHKGRQPW